MCCCCVAEMSYKHGRFGPHQQQEGACPAQHSGTQTEHCSSTLFISAASWHAWTHCHLYSALAEPPRQGDADLKCSLQHLHQRRDCQVELLLCIFIRSCMRGLPHALPSHQTGLRNRPYMAGDSTTTSCQDARITNLWQAAGTEALPHQSRSCCCSVVNGSCLDMNIVCKTIRFLPSAWAHLAWCPSQSPRTPEHAVPPAAAQTLRLHQAPPSCHHPASLPQGKD